MANISWKTGTSGVWSDGALWSTGTVPAAVDNVTIAAAPAAAGQAYIVSLTGSYAIHSLVLQQALATLDLGSNPDKGTLSVSGTAQLVAGQVVLSEGILLGGTYIDQSVGLDIGGNANAIEDVAWDGRLSLIGYYYDRQVPYVLLSGVSFHGLNGTGAGALIADTNVLLAPGQTLDNVAVVLGGGASIGDERGQSNPLQFGSASSLRLAAPVGGKQTTAFLYGDVINNGLITLGGSAPGGGLRITGASLENSGTISVGLNGRLALQSTTLTNTGVISVGAGGILLFDGAGMTALPDLAGIQVAAGGTLGLGGQLANYGTLSVGAGTTLPRFFLAGGVIGGGTISDTGGGLVLSAGELNGVTYRGTLTASVAGATTIVGGLTVVPFSGAGIGSIALTGAGASLNFTDTETLSNVDIAIGSTSPSASTLYGSGLTLASTVVIQQTGLFAAVDGNITNQGTILAAQAGGSLTLDVDLANSGTIAVSNGETLVLQYAGTISNSGVLSVTDGELDIGNVNASQLSAITLVNSGLGVNGTLTATGTTLIIGAGTNIPFLKMAPQAVNGSQYTAEIVGGTIRDAGGGLQIYGQNDVLNGVTYRGDLAIDLPLAVLTVMGGLAVRNFAGTAAGTITLTGVGSTLLWKASQALDNATLLIGNNASSYLGHSVAAPMLTSHSGGTVHLGANLAIQQAGTFAALGDSGYLPSFASAGSIQANVAGGQFSLTAYDFTNTGTIAVSQGDSFIDDSDLFNNMAVLTLGTGSTFTVDLYEHFAVGDPSGVVFFNSGRIVLAGGLMTEPTGNFASVPIQNPAGGQIEGFGTLDFAVINSGAIEAASGTLSVTGAVSGAGTLLVDASATLVLGGAVAKGQIAAFGGASGVLGLQGASFLGAIGGFAAGDTIDVAGEQAASAKFSGASILLTLTNGHTLSLATTTAQTGNLAVHAGTHGDTLITFAGAAAVGGPVFPEVAPPAIGHRAGFGAPEHDGGYGDGWLAHDFALAR